VTHKFAKHLIFAVSALALTVGAANATESCATNDLAVTTGLVCTLGDLTFTFSQVNPSSGTVEFLAPYTGIDGDDYNLDFQIAGGSPSGDLVLEYEVQDSAGAQLSQVDSSFGATGDTAPPSTISEDVCSGIVDGACSGLITAYTNSTGALTFSSTFGPLSQVYIIKDIDYGSPGVISTFTDSVVATPEPSSLGLLLVAAFGIAVSARKFRKVQA
jgi:hypothetical protein